MKVAMTTIALSTAFLMMSCGGGTNDAKENGSNAEKNGKEAKKAKKDTSGLTKRGADFDKEGAFAVADLPGRMEGKDSLQVKVKGEVKRVCQKKGCWMELDMGPDHSKMMVRFKDYGFFVPKDAAGSKAMMKGWAFRDTVSVEKLRHYAKDKGKSQEAIDSIQDPEVRLAFKASGVVLKEGDKGGK